MNVLEAIKKRREITEFEDKSLDQTELEQIVDAGYLAPSGNNLPSKELIVVTNRKVLSHLSKATPFMPWLAGAAAGIVVLGRPDVSKYWLQDASIASGYLWLEAVERGVGGAFGAIYHAEDQEESERRESYVRKSLEIPEDRRVLAILGFGYRAKQPAAKKLLPREALVHYEKFASNE